MLDCGEAEAQLLVLDADGLALMVLESSLLVRPKGRDLPDQVAHASLRTVRVARRTR